LNPRSALRQKLTAFCFRSHWDVLQISAHSAGRTGIRISRIKDEKEILADIKHHAFWHKNTRRVFLMDGDALILSSKKLVPILDRLGQEFPKLARVASYANGSNITRKSDAELAELSARKLTLIYMGLESGSQKILDHCGKSSSVKEMITAVRRAEAAGIKSSVIVLLGLGGTAHSSEHVAATIEALNQMQPRYLSFLSLMVIPDTLLEEEVARGDFEELNAVQMLEESRAIIEGLQLSKTIFRSNHASNYLPLEGVFPKDKGRLLQDLNAALNGKILLRPEFLRGL
jgi:radical SAM superfamily enzyme YgiQ (UPF0313 family)